MASAYLLVFSLPTPEVLHPQSMLYNDVALLMNHLPLTDYSVCPTSKLHDLVLGIENNGIGIRTEVDLAGGNIRAKHITSRELEHTRIVQDNLMLRARCVGHWNVIDKIALSDHTNATSNFPLPPTIEH